MGFTKKLVFIFILLIVMLSLVVSAEMPVSADQIKSDLMRKFSKDKYFKYEVTELGRYYQEERGLFIYPYYGHMCYIYWEGSFGQIIREHVDVYYIKTDGMWLLDTYQVWDKDTTLTQGPTKPLPVIEQPTQEFITKTLEEALPKLTFSSDYIFKIKKLELGEPKFEWRGWDYEYGAFIYEGSIEYTQKYGWSKKEVKRELKLFMFYSRIDAKWQCEINWKN